LLTVPTCWRVLFSVLAARHVRAISSNHLRFPTTSAMATMPAHLLEALPTLPKDLEYRFAGRTLILRDRDAALIIDFLPAALPK
jgi:hypothetical protein